MRKAREDRENKKMMTERGYNPNAKTYTMKHGKEKAVSQQKAFNYSHPRKRTTIAKVRPEGESTLYKGIHHQKYHKGGHFEPDQNPASPQTSTPNAYKRKKEAEQEPNSERRTAKDRSANIEKKRQTKIEEQKKEAYKRPQVENKSPLKKKGKEESPQIVEEKGMDDQQAEYNDGEENQENEGSQPSEGEGGEGAPQPLLFVDVNLGPGRAERIVVYEGDTAEALAQEFTDKHSKHFYFSYPFRS